MNYTPIHTNIYPSYNYLAAENAFLKQSIEYKDAVLGNQQETISNLNKDVQQLSMANVTLKQERDRAMHDLKRWRALKESLRPEGQATCDPAATQDAESCIRTPAGAAETVVGAPGLEPGTR